MVSSCEERSYAISYAQMMRAMRDDMDINEALRRVGAVHRLQRRSPRARDGMPVAHSKGSGGGVGAWCGHGSECTLLAGHERSRV